MGLAISENVIVWLNRAELSCMNRSVSSRCYSCILWYVITVIRPRTVIGDIVCYEWHMLLIGSSKQLSMLISVYRSWLQRSTSASSVSSSLHTLSTSQRRIILVTMVAMISAAMLTPSGGEWWVLAATLQFHFVLMTASLLCWCSEVCRSCSVTEHVLLCSLFVLYLQVDLQILCISLLVHWQSLQ